MSSTKNFSINIIFLAIFLLFEIVTSPNLVIESNKLFNTLNDSLVSFLTVSNVETVSINDFISLTKNLLIAIIAIFDLTNLITPRLPKFETADIKSSTVLKLSKTLSFIFVFKSFKFPSNPLIY